MHFSRSVAVRRRHEGTQQDAHRGSMVDGSLGARAIDQGQIVTSNVAPLIVKKVIHPATPDASPTRRF
jgi:hypothetical protein